ncbi:MAG: hypothetical protein LBS96_01670 [Oscillospiraceae bacterium]|jgi:hypothetical protein|nr:hypothetical protein [Oscillospiraceae bacterium]
MAIAKRPTRPNDGLDGQRSAQEEEVQRQRALEQEKDRIRILAEQRGQNERSIMDGLVETDTQPRALEALVQSSLEVNEWYLRYMVIEKLGRQILLASDYTQEELQAWLVPFALNDANSFVRRAAIKHLTDLTALAQASANDAEPCVRKRAVKRLFCFLDAPAALEALDAVSCHDPEAELRLMAVERIVDQSVLAIVAKSDVEPTIRQAATRKLTGQDVLAWVLLNDPTVQVRSTAAERMTDVSALVQTAFALSNPVKQAPGAAEAAVDELAGLEEALEI